MYLIHPHHSILDLKELKAYLNGKIITDHSFHECIYRLVLQIVLTDLRLGELSLQEIAPLFSMMFSLNLHFWQIIFSRFSDSLLV